ncbi:MAG: adenine methyltransferase [Patescibacteria group bacterium]|nr:adenine methyltransferase [Patescibacteria group bacterium]
MNTLFETGNDGSEATTHDWLTPPEILSALGEFDLDPCASQHQPWKTANKQYTIVDDGLTKKWNGRVWCNPPYGAFANAWIAKSAVHGNAMALLFARTETAMFQDFIWPKADALLFLRGRVSFRLPGGGKAGPAGAPSVLVAYGHNNAFSLEHCGLSGAFVRLRL